MNTEICSRREVDGIIPCAELKILLHEIFSNEVLIKTNKKIEYFNTPCAFDIETTSFYDKGEKRGIMYEWTLGLNDYVFFGRTWKEFVESINIIAEYLETGKNRRLIVYVHNLAFEFQFIRKWFSWETVFATAPRKPIYAINDLGIEFRCSYILSGYPLSTLGKKLRKYKVEKMVGDLDYSKLRHSETPLTKKEWKYCENDVRVVMCYIRECMESDGDITKIPLTKTGYVRNYCRKSILYSGNHKNSFKFIRYRKLMNCLQLDVDEYKQLKRAFQGGFTHCNSFYSGKTQTKVCSFDFTSSYPTVMIAEKFPMSRGEIVDIKNYIEFEHNLALYCCLFDIEFDYIESISMFEHYISRSKCWDVVGAIEDNGRIVSADRIKMSITEQDFFIIRKFYKWNGIKIGTFRRYRRGYLPTDFIKSILKLYQDKTQLKGVSGREDDYLRSKEMINSCYGMCVTDICQDINAYVGDEWTSTMGDFEKLIEKDNSSKKRFLFYPWGIWVTAYARKNLFAGIMEFGNDYIYADTDSIKGLRRQKHLKFIRQYNQDIISKLERAMDFHQLPHELIRPKTIKGKEKPLGVWDYEGQYSRFKSLGAKRYITEKKHKISITVSGINKKNAVPYLLQKYGKDGVFDAFSDDLVIPKESTGKLTHTYLDEEYSGILTDYRGRKSTYYEKSGIHLEPTEYNFSISELYEKYLLGIREEQK